jgi:hypothetical protein
MVTENRENYKHVQQYQHLQRSQYFRKWKEILENFVGTLRYFDQEWKSKDRVRQEWVKYENIITRSRSNISCSVVY